MYVFYAVGVFCYLQSRTVPDRLAESLAGYPLLAIGVLLPLWGLELFFWWALNRFPRAAAKWAFNRALRKDGDWFRRRARGILKNAARLAFILIGLFVLACVLSSMDPSGSLSTLPRSLAVAAVHTAKTLFSDLKRIPWTWPGGALVGASVLLAFKKWNFHRKLEFSHAPRSADQQALMDRVQQMVGANVTVGYSRGLTPADAKAYFVGQRICLNPCRSLDLNAQQIAFSYDIKTRQDYPQASKAVCP